MPDGESLAAIATVEALVPTEVELDLHRGSEFGSRLTYAEVVAGLWVTDTLTTPLEMFNSWGRRGACGLGPFLQVGRQRSLRHLCSFFLVLGALS